MSSFIEQGRVHPASEQVIFPQPELYPFPELVKVDMAETTRLTAIPVRQIIDDWEFVPEGMELPDNIKEERTLKVDNEAAFHMANFIPNLGYVVESVGCEGLKDIEKLGANIDLILGRYGSGNKGISMVIDPVEGSKFATHNRPGAISIVATNSFGGLLPTPKDIKYLEKLFGPPELSGKLSIYNDPATNMDIARQVFGVSANEVNVVTMNRKANQGIIEAANNIGANIKLIETGDLMPSLLAVSSPESKARNGNGIYLVMGRGGFEEGTIAAVAARALGGHAEARIWSSSKDDKDLPAFGGRVLGINDLVPGRAEQSLVTFTPITDDPWFGYNGIVLNNGRAVGQTIQIDNNGFRILPFERRIAV